MCYNIYFDFRTNRAITSADTAVFDLRKPVKRTRAVIIPVCKHVCYCKATFKTYKAALTVSQINTPCMIIIKYNVLTYDTFAAFTFVTLFVVIRDSNLVKPRNAVQ